MFFVKQSLAYSCATVPRKQLIVVFYRISSFLLVVVVWTVRLSALAILEISTLLHTVDQGMEFLLLPAVTTAATVLKLAAVLVCLCILLRLPKLALLFSILVDVRLSSEVLPVVCVNAFFALMILVRKWTPHCFKVKHIEISILFHLLNHIHGKLTFTVRESAKFAIVAAVYAIGISLTEFCFVFFWVVEILNAIMRKRTTFSYLAFI